MIKLFCKVCASLCNICPCLKNSFRRFKVIDAGSFIAGAVSTTILSDFGAEVIKIEPPKIGDSLRHLITRTKRVNPVSDKDYCWHLTSRNKKSLALNLGNPKGQKFCKNW